LQIQGIDLLLRVVLFYRLGLMLEVLCEVAMLQLQKLEYEKRIDQSDLCEVLTIEPTLSVVSRCFH
jgi:hypothetical protein